MGYEDILEDLNNQSIIFALKQVVIPITNPDGELSLDTLFANFFAYYSNSSASIQNTLTRIFENITSMKNPEVIFQHEPFDLILKAGGISNLQGLEETSQSPALALQQIVKKLSEYIKGHETESY
jgi:hypothetical protein